MGEAKQTLGAAARADWPDRHARAIRDRWDCPRHHRLPYLPASPDSEGLLALAEGWT
jgi:hypothetical protein